MERYRSGHNEAVLKTVCPQGHVGSNPTFSATSRRILWVRRFRLKTASLCGLPLLFPKKTSLFGMPCLAGLQAFANPHLLCRNLPCFALNLSISCYRTVYSPSRLSLKFCLNNRDENKYLPLSNSRCVRVSFESASY